MNKLKKTLFVLISILAISLILPITAKADNINEREVMVSVNETYKSILFDITLPYNDGYSISIISPDKDVYEATFVSELEAQCVIEDVKRGQWVILLKRNQAVEPNDSEGEDVISVRELPIIHVEAKGSLETLMPVEKDITVAADIAGLKMYFKDFNFVAEWTDVTIGKVNIEVINAENLQKIDAQTVQGNHYECPLTEDINEILVKIVPAVSASVVGADKTYTFVFDNNPKATVLYENLEITNHDTLKVKCELEDSYAVQILINGKESEKTDLLDAGEYDFEAPIDAGTNEIITYIIDADNNMRSTSYTIEKDVVAPTLELVSTYQDITTTDEYLTIEGSVNDFDYLRINNAQVEVEGDNTFKFDYKLKEGINSIAVIASDKAGNETEYDISVERIIPQDNKLPWIKIIIIACAIGFLGIYLFEIIKKRNNPTADSDGGKISFFANRRERSVEEKYDIKGDNPDKTRLVELIGKERQEIIWDVLSFAIPIVAILIIMTKVLIIGTVESGSMEPKLAVGNTVFYNRLAYTNAKPERGDIVIFKTDRSEDVWGKRIIGLPGDTIEFKDGYVVINGQYCDESDYLDPDIETNCSKTFEVPANSYFVLGDNRDYSYDSRYWEDPYIGESEILGKHIGQIDFSFKYMFR